jgi:hypothetical protein
VLNILNAPRLISHLNSLGLFCDEGRCFSTCDAISNRIDSAAGSVVQGIYYGFMFGIAYN